MKTEKLILQAAERQFGPIDKVRVVRGSRGWEVHVNPWKLGDGKPSAHAAEADIYRVSLSGGVHFEKA